jgi:proteasome lid subunit RPN8/RPN11
MVMVLEDRMVQEIARIGRLRAPAEACGILLPYAVNGRQIVELPNRSLEENHEFELWGEDIALIVEELQEHQTINAQFLRETVIWHTHPRGNLGPSRFDMDNKPPEFQSLVVTLFEDGTAKGTWF